MHGDSQVVPTQPSLLPTAPIDPIPIMTSSGPPSDQVRQPSPRPARRPGRPATYVFDKPDDQLTEKERKTKIAIEKRRLRQNRSYHRRKKFRKTLSDIKDNFHKHTRADPATTSIFSSTTDPVHSSRSVASSPHDSTNQAWSISNGSVAVPKFIVGFTQNPLDLLAPTGTEDIDQIPPPDPSQPPVSAEQAIRDATATAAAQSQDIKTDVELDRVSERPAPDYQESMQDIPPSNSSNAILGSPENPDDGALNLAPGASLDIGAFSFDLDQPKGVEEETQQATEVLVNSALVAAKQYASNPMNMKDPVPDQDELIRSAGIKQLVFDNLRSLYISMSPPIQDAVRHFVVFPNTFNITAALAIAGLESSQQATMQGMLDTLKHANFIKTKKGRYELTEMGRLFLSEDQSVLSYNIAENTFEVARTRFIDYYRSKLNELQNESIHKIGWFREQAMATYDTERENMEFVEYLLAEKKFELREFLSAGITVMRYCVSPSKREIVLRKALEDEETSTESILFGFGEEGSALGSGSSHDVQNPGPCDKPYKARLQLALSEAYFDQLKIEAAEEPLVRALKLMGDAAPAVPRCSKPSSGIVDSVLVLLLLSNLRLSHKRIRDARLLCVKAMKILVEAGLGRSTFGINAMSNLVTIYLEEGNVEKAKSVAGRLLGTLKTMRYTGMPIYADALGVCALISMAEKNYAEAEQQYRTALEVMGKWGAKDWAGIPVQHCLDLDMWLMEGMAESIDAQGRREEAVTLEERASGIRKSRGLNISASVTDYLQMGEQDGTHVSSLLRSRPTLRHLY